MCVCMCIWSFSKEYLRYKCSPEPTEGKMKTYTSFSCNAFCTTIKLSLQLMERMFYLCHTIFILLWCNILFCRLMMASNFSNIRKHEDSSLFNFSVFTLKYVLWLKRLLCNKFLWPLRSEWEREKEKMNVCMDK